jgi:hypothetical protein
VNPWGWSRVFRHPSRLHPLPRLRVTVATKRLNGFFREIELLENRIFNPPRTIYFNYSTFNVSHVLQSTKNASKD